jgi:SRSO17 transposase
VQATTTRPPVTATADGEGVGTAGRIENAQVAVYLTYAGRSGHSMIDRELYLPSSWASDEQRLAEAGVPDDIGFLTKPALAAGMLTRGLDAGVPARWVARR